MTPSRTFVWMLLITWWSAMPLRAQPPAMPDTLTLNDVIRLTVTNHPAMQGTLEDVRAASARVEQSRSAELPTADGIATYVRIDPVPEFEIGGHPLELAPHDNFDLHVGASYNIYDFGRARDQTRLSRGRMKSVEDAVPAVRTHLEFAAARAFYSILFLRRTLMVQDQEIAALNEHLNVAQRKVDAGTAITYDVLATQVRVAAVQNQRADAVSALERQRTALRELLGLPLDSPVNVKGQLSVDTVSLNEDSLSAAALRRRPEMQLARDAENVARLQQRVAVRRDWPTLRAGAQYGFKNGYVPNLNAWRGNWAGIAELRVPIYRGRRSDFESQEAAANLRSEQYKRQTLERQIRGDVQRAADDVRTALNKLRISEVRIRQAQDAVNIARVRYLSGAITNVDVLDAETSLAEAQLAQEQVVFSYVMARTALQQALGGSPLP